MCVDLRIALEYFVTMSSSICTVRKRQNVVKFVMNYLSAHKLRYII